MLKSHSYPAARFISEYQLLRNGITQAGSFATPTSFGTDILTTVNNPDWQVKVAKHVDAGSDYLVRKQMINNFLVAHGYVKEPSYTWESYVHQLPSLASMTDFTDTPQVNANSWLKDCQSSALTKVKNRLSVKSGKFTSLVTLGEARETAMLYQQLVGLTTKFLTGIVTAKKRVIKNPKRALEDFTVFCSEAWLTYAFGVMPTVSDFEGLVQSVLWRTQRIHNIRERGRDSVHWNTQQRQNITLCGSTVGTVVAEVHLNHSYTVDFIYSAGRYIDLDSANGFSIPDQFGLNWSEIIPAAVELFPFSWLLAYFTTSDDVIQDVFTSPAGNTVYNYETRVQKWHCSSSTDVKRSTDLGTKPAGGYVSTSPDCIGKVIRRTKLSALPHTDLRIKSFPEIARNWENRLSNLFSIVAPMAIRK